MDDGCRPDVHNPAMREYDVIIVGAGAAGLMCAGTAAAGGRSVLLIDHAEKAGKKILISGGGRCNFTNLYVSAADFISQNPHFCKSALTRFSSADFIAMVDAAGIAWHERDHGQLFCASSAAAIVEMLLARCRQYGVDLRLNTAIESISREDGQFQVATSRGVFTAPALVVATGGLSIPKMGATPFGLKLAASFGLKIVPAAPGLVPFTFTGADKERLQRLSGISLPVRVSCRGRSFNEAMLFTHRGLSGPAMLQISSYWRPGDELVVDLLPSVDIEAFLSQQKESRPEAGLAGVLAGLLPKRLVQLLTSSLIGNRRLKQLDEREIERIAGQLHGWRLKPNGTEGYRTAEVTVGGVDTGELSSKTMESKKVPGLYFIGEVVDVTGHLGGFNFQWAWASGHAAGLALTGG